MAEVQTTTESGEMTQRFIEFVMMQAQNAALFLGQIPNPRGGEPEVNLQVAKMFIDQLVMIRAKTRGNLSNEELAVLNNAISNLQMAFFEASQKEAKAGKVEPSAASVREEPETPSPAAETTGTPAAPTAETEEAESKKKFSKSYGAS